MGCPLGLRGGGLEELLAGWRGYLRVHFCFVGLGCLQDPLCPVE